MQHELQSSEFLCILPHNVPRDLFGHTLTADAAFEDKRGRGAWKGQNWTLMNSLHEKARPYADLGCVSGGKWTQIVLNF